MRERTWTLEDHLCASCGGRILRCATNTGMTPGGNPLFKCADCGKSASGSNAGALCWCGVSHRGQTATPYRCLPFSILESRPELERAFRGCGCDPARGEIGIVLERDLAPAAAPAQKPLLERAAVLKAVEDEPEAEDALTDEMWMTLSTDRDALVQFCRILVRGTKQGIRDRISGL